MAVSARDPDRLGALVAELASEGLPVRAASSLSEAVEQADIVCATTHAADPVVRRAWVRAGTHVNSVGYNAAGAGEVDLDLVRDAYVVVETREAALAPPPAGAIELLRAIDAGLPDPIDAELGSLVLGTASGRQRPDEITLYKSVGIAAQDAAAASLVLAEATRRSVGRQVEL
jgi:ornithine cyclodeaminase